MSNTKSTRTMIAAARALQPPAGWGMSWVVRVLDGDVDAGQNEHDELEDAIADVRHFRRVGLGARLEARLVGPVLA